MKLNQDVHFDGWPTATAKDFTDSPTNAGRGFCVLCLVDIDGEQHQLFFNADQLAKVQRVVAAMNGKPVFKTGIPDAWAKVLAGEAAA